MDDQGGIKRIEIHYERIPHWLRESDFYSSLNNNELESLIEIPCDYFRENDDAIDTVQDLVHILQVTRFWGVTTIPYSVLEFCFAHSFKEWGSAVVDVVGEERLSVFHTLKNAFERPDDFSLWTAMNTRREEVISFWMAKIEPDSKHGKKAIEFACRRGKIDLVKTLRERHYNWDTEAYCAAAQYGHISMLQYLLEEGCPWDKRAYLYAQSSGQTACMQCLKEHGQSYP